MDPSKTPGQIGYEAYARHTGGVTFDGREMPTWEALRCSGTKVAGAWEAAARAILLDAPRPHACCQTLAITGGDAIQVNGHHRDCQRTG